ncbi:MAG: 1-acyl-sn-glycerol-3-phosphate acyltransferase [Amoebophilaceae bacterium]|nr:1-acyl-sn-glycerol-3-phosphate acyltransferase [Amoebophilaceae bacterium]
MRQKQPYAPIIPQYRDWPVVQLNQHRRAFVRTVMATSVQTLMATYPESDALRAMLRKTAEMELMRIEKKPWKVDPPDDAAFWKQLITALEGQSSTVLPAILHEVVERYAHEIAGRFRISHYRLGQRAVTYTLARLLNPISLKGVRNPWRMQSRLQEKIHITGAVTQLRALAQLGTVIMVPTHASHLDSLLMAWVIHVLGLPHFVYGAGLNLFNSRFFAYFLNNLGTYKVDRRKKNSPYLTTLKTYSSLALQWGCHSLFYPGGTRSRSGALERQLKLGLLGTAFAAQQRTYQDQGRAARKIFVVPVVLNYHCVLEAPRLIKNYLADQGLCCVRTPSSHELLKFANNVFTKDSSVFVSIGQAMDLLGNAVDEAGHSYNTRGVYVDTYQQLLDIGTTMAVGKQYENATIALGKAIVKAYYKVNCVLASHLLAFVAFELFKQQHAALSFQALLQLPLEKLVIPYVKLELAFAHLRVVILDLYKAGRLQVEPSLPTESLDTLVQQGLNNLGLYHSKRPLLQNQAGDVITQDLGTLLYYHNRLQGYALEKYIS